MSTFTKEPLDGEFLKTILSRFKKPTAASVSSIQKIAAKVAGPSVLADKAPENTPEPSAKKPNILLIVGAIAAAIGGYLYLKKK